MHSRQYFEVKSQRSKVKGPEAQLMQWLMGRQADINVSDLRPRGTWWWHRV